MLPNKRLKLAGADRSKGIGVLCPWWGTDCRPTLLRRRASRLQLKRDPLGSTSMRPRTFLLILVLIVPSGSTVQGQIPSPDSLLAWAGHLSGCYRISLLDSVPHFRIQPPRSLQLSDRWFTTLGYHRLGFFEVRPKHVDGHSLVAWRPFTRDSLSVEFGATSTFSPRDMILSGRALGDSLTGVIADVTYTSFPPDTIETVRVIRSTRFVGRKTACR